MYGILSKCAFYRPEIHYLDHIILGDGVSLDPSKIMAVMDWPTPTSVTEVRIFIRLVGYYQCFIVGFPTLAHSITSLQIKGNKYKWIEK